MLSAEASSAISGWVRSLLFGTGQGGGALLDSDFSVRKLAHFLEFASLGLLLAWLMGMLQKNTWYLPLGLGAAAAFLDEFIQHFSPGRAPRLFDLGIDTLGVCLGIVLMNLVTYLRRKRI